MSLRKKTLRRMSPTARKLARLMGELDSIQTRIKNLIPEIESLELDSAALKNARAVNPPDNSPIFTEDEK